MKFGKALRAAAVPEWLHAYVDYKALKQLIKQVIGAGGDRSSGDENSQDPRFSPPTASSMLPVTINVSIRRAAGGGAALAEEARYSKRPMTTS
jgi:hypothetical protein